MAHIRQSSPDSGPAFQDKVLETFQAVAVSLGSGPETPLPRVGDDGPASVQCKILKRGEIRKPGGLLGIPNPNLCRANVARVRQSRPDSGLVFEVKVRKTFKVVPSWLGIGPSPLRSESDVSKEVVSSVGDDGEADG